MEDHAAASTMLFPLLIMAIPLTIASCALARAKGRNAVLWGILSLIPIVNLGVIYFLVGCPDLNIERKIDAILSAVGAKDTSQINRG